MLKKVLIANRGEIALRVAQALRELGIGVITVYADPDRTAPHVAAGDEAHHLVGTTAAETYLDIRAIIEAAHRHGADGIHPGYGFLSENPGFARACAAAGLTFIGPRAETIEAMGDKIVAKRRMAEAGVPVVPGTTDAESDPAALAAHAETIGYPLLVKAAAGGGGRGMRVVEAPAAFSGALEAARREAIAAFGDGRVLLERYIRRARHVEFQILGDDHGNVVHLFERDCSIQRRHQKIIEEAPAPRYAPALREQMGEAAVRAAQAIGYAGAGTVEFMVAGDQFFFLEVNTRLQVEHPVTEMTTLQDLVHAQVRVAAGEALPFEQRDLRQHGHAIECRIYAEDPARDFAPSTGTLDVFEPPSGPGIRVDSGVLQGSEVTVHYDPMLAKLTVWAATRDEAIARMIGALDRFIILGVTTNIDFLRRVVAHEAFRAAALHTQFLETNDLLGPPRGATPDEAIIVAALAAAGPPSETGRRAPRDDRRVGPWTRAGGWRAR